MYHSRFCKGMITALCVTYGRVRWLEQALADFLAQEKPGPSELLIVNTFPKQTLKGEFPNVRIMNLTYRPGSLGHARNLGVADAKGDRIIIYDDDDRYLPHHIRMFTENWTPGEDWLWLDKRFFADGDQIKGILRGCHGGCFGFTKRAWSAVGGYPDLTVGEDRQLVQRITKFPGKIYRIGNQMPPFIACWGNGVYHISGQGDDQPTSITAHVRAESALARRMGSGEEKTGTIQLQPNATAKWLSKATAFMESELKKKAP